MLVLAIRTDKPEAELGLFDNAVPLAYHVWHAHRELSSTLLQKITDLLRSRNKTLQDLEGIVCFQGPGSFTGLRIGLTVANALAYSLHIPVAASAEDAWAQRGIERLQAGENDIIALPHYGAEAHITLPRS